MKMESHFAERNPPEILSLLSPLALAFLSLAFSLEPDRKGLNRAKSGWNVLTGAKVTSFGRVLTSDLETWSVW